MPAARWVRGELREVGASMVVVRDSDGDFVISDRAFTESSALLEMESGSADKSKLKKM